MVDGDSKSRREGKPRGLDGEGGAVASPGKPEPSDEREVILGPDLNSPKSCPVLAAVGDKVYALSRHPSWKWKSEPDFPPWFEVLDLQGAQVVHREGSDHLELEGCSWKSLEIPPCLPWKLTPLQYTMLPMVVAESYVVVDSYILVSYNQPWGTYAFDTNLHKWHKVDSNELPFVGYATPLGSVFLGSSKQWRVIEAYCINVKASDQDHALKLSITVLPVEYDEGEESDEDSLISLEKELVADPCFLSLENGRICLPSFLPDSNSMTLLPNHDNWFARKASVNLRTYQIDNISLLETPEETLQTMKPAIVFSSRVEQAFTVSNVRHGFFSQGFTFLSI